MKVLFQDFQHYYSTTSLPIFTFFKNKILAGVKCYVDSSHAIYVTVFQTSWQFCLQVLALKVSQLKIKLLVYFCLLFYFFRH